MDEDDMLIDAETHPLEFALIVCDILTDGGIDSSDAVTLDPGAISGGFEIVVQLGERISLSILYEENFKKFVGTVSASSDQTTQELLNAALLLNSEMPDVRRFSINGSGALCLKESWSVTELEISALAGDLRKLVSAIHILINRVRPQLSSSNPLSMLRG